MPRKSLATCPLRMAYQALTATKTVTYRRMEVTSDDRGPPASSRALKQPINVLWLEKSFIAGDRRPDASGVNAEISHAAPDYRGRTKDRRSGESGIGAGGICRGRGGAMCRCATCSRRHPLRCGCCRSRIARWRRGHAGTGAKDQRQSTSGPHAYRT